MNADTEHQPCFVEITRLQRERDLALLAQQEAERLAFSLREALGVLLSRARQINGYELHAGRVTIDLSKEIDLAKKAMAGEELVP